MSPSRTVVAPLPVEPSASAAIVLDTSALMAVLLGEPEGEACAAVLGTDAKLLISAGTLAEALVVAGHRRIGLEMAALVDKGGVEVVPMTAGTAARVAEAYALWGKGNHPAGLNLGDCFAYALAKELGCPLLYVGRDFARTDLMAARPEAPTGAEHDGEATDEGPPRPSGDRP